MDEFLDSPDLELTRRSIELLNQISGPFADGTVRNPLDRVATSILLDWCQKGSSHRYEALSAVIGLCRTYGNGPKEWSDIALTILESSPDKVVTLRHYSSRLWPSAWSGSQGETMRDLWPLWEALAKHPENLVSNYAREHLGQFVKETEAQLALERSRSIRRDELFE